MKKHIVKDFRVVLDPPRYLWGCGRDMNGVERALKAWASDMEDFIRDHRSQDPVSISVEAECEEVCAFCGREWEEDEDGRPVCCNEAVAEWESSAVVAQEESHDEPLFWIRMM